jgi:hypothetical protein
MRWKPLQVGSGPQVSSNNGSANTDEQADRRGHNALRERNRRATYRVMHDVPHVLRGQAGISPRKAHACIE